MESICEVKQANLLVQPRIGFPPFYLERRFSISYCFRSCQSKAHCNEQFPSIFVYSAMSILTQILVIGMFVEQFMQIRHQVVIYLMITAARRWLPCTLRTGCPIFNKLYFWNKSSTVEFWSSIFVEKKDDASISDSSVLFMLGNLFPVSL